MEGFFQMRKSHISATIKTFIDVIYCYCRDKLNSPELFAHRIPYYAQLIEQKTNRLVNFVWGFIDGTLCKTCRPKYFQKECYSGHKRYHGLKFQSVVTPDGLLCQMVGPVNGKWHDSYMLRESRLVGKLQNLMPINGIIYALYGDPAYPQSRYLLGGYRVAPPGSAIAAFNTAMFSMRIVVEWGCTEIIENWSFLDLRKSMKIFKFPVAKYYIIAAFLCNCRTRFYGNQISLYFNANVMSLENYLIL
jgi:hypothetical protein